MKKLLKFVLLLTVCCLTLPRLTVTPGLSAEDTLHAPTIPVTAPEELPLPEDTLPAGPAEMPVCDRETTLRLLQGTQVREMTMEEYLLGVLAAEVPAGFPEEALKAQAVAARTYAFYKMALYREESMSEAGHQGADLCDDPSHCEAYVDLTAEAAALWGSSADIYRRRLCDAVSATDGLILVYEDAPIAAVYCAASGPVTERASDIWGRELPYLTSVESPGGADCSQYEGTVTVEQTVFAELVTGRWPEADLTGAPSAWFRDSHRTKAGSIVDVLVGNVRVKGSEVRSLLGLNSANFKVKVQGSDLVFSTVGYGHGVGMSQYGARYMALEGKTYDQILAHYYPGTDLRLEG